MRSHDAFTALSRRSPCVHCAVTAFALCFHGVCTALTAWHLKKYVNIRNCSNQNLNPAPKTKTGNNYMCNIKNSQNTREHIVNRVSSYFLKAKFQCRPARCLLPVEIMHRCGLATGPATVELLPYLLPY